MKSQLDLLLEECNTISFENDVIMHKLNEFNDRLNVLEHSDTLHRISVLEQSYNDKMRSFKGVHLEQCNYNSQMGFYNGIQSDAYKSNLNWLKGAQSDSYNYNLKG